MHETETINLICKCCSKEFQYEIRPGNSYAKIYCNPCVLEKKRSRARSYYKRKVIKLCKICYEPITTETIKYHKVCLDRNNSRKVTAEEFGAAQLGAWDEPCDEVFTVMSELWKKEIL